MHPEQDPHLHHHRAGQRKRPLRICQGLRLPGVVRCCQDMPTDYRRCQGFTLLRNRAQRPQTRKHNGKNCLMVGGP